MKKKNAKKPAVSAAQKLENELLFQVKKLIETNAEEVIGSMEYLIKKVTTQKEKMKEVDFLAASNAMKLITFLKMGTLYQSYYKKE